MEFKTVTVAQMRTVKLGSRGTRSVIFETRDGERIELDTGVKECDLKEGSMAFLYNNHRIYSSFCQGCLALSCQLAESKVGRT